MQYDSSVQQTALQWESADARASSAFSVHNDRSVEVIAEGWYLIVAAVTVQVSNVEQKLSVVSNKNTDVVATIHERTHQSVYAETLSVTTITRVSSHEKLSVVLSPNNIPVWWHPSLTHFSLAKLA
jgi:hypothetical protein